MLTTQEILQKVRLLEIRSKMLVDHLFTGTYHSAFRGQGMQFKEVRAYHPGDDIRFMDWNVSARMGHPYSKVFEEERELSMMLLVDMSASSVFGTTRATRQEVIQEICAVLAFAALKNQDKVGLLIFSDQIERYIPPKKGREHILYIVRELLTIKPKGKGTDLAKAIRYFNNLTRQKNIVFLLSDFMSDDFADDLRVAAMRHDVIGLRVIDPFDQHLPALGMMLLQDAESGEKVWVDSNDPLVQYQFRKGVEWADGVCRDAFRRAAASLLHIRTDEDHVHLLQQFFKKRR